MRYLIFSFVVLFLSSFTKPVDQFPDVTLKDMSGKTVRLHDIFEKNEKTIISFWATWCSPCKLELDAIAEVYEEWKEEYGVELIAITIDNARGLASAPGLVQTKGWEYDILVDKNQDMLRALNFQTIPQTFVVDNTGKIIYSHNGYTPGDEYELEDQLK